MVWPRSITILGHAGHKEKNRSSNWTLNGFTLNECQLSQISDKVYKNIIQSCFWLNTAKMHHHKHVNSDQKSLDAAPQQIDVAVYRGLHHHGMAWLCPWIERGLQHDNATKNSKKQLHVARTGTIENQASRARSNVSSLDTQLLASSCSTATSSHSPSASIAPRRRWWAVTVSSEPVPAADGKLPVQTGTQSTPLSTSYTIYDMTWDYAIWYRIKRN